MFCLFKYFYSSHSPLVSVISVSFRVLYYSSVNSVHLWTLWEKEIFSSFLVYYLIKSLLVSVSSISTDFCASKELTEVFRVILSPFLSCLFLIHLTRYNSPLCYSVFFLSCLFPIHFTRHYCSLCYSVSFLSSFFLIHLTRYYCSLCYSVSSLSCLFPIHFTRHYCSLCYSVSFLSCLSPPHPTIVTVFFVTLSPLTLSLFHFFVALSQRCFSLLFFVYESIFSSSVDLIFLLYSIPIVYYKTIYLCLYLYIFSCYYLSI